MKPVAVHHVSLTVDDVALALEFYVDTLGLSARDDRPDFGFAGAWLDAGGQQLHLIEGEPPPDKGQHFAILVDDLDATIAELRQRQIKVSDGSPVGTGRQAFLKDPAGNTVELHETAASTP